MQTVRHFLEDYSGFDYENGEVVIVQQGSATLVICTPRIEEDGSISLNYMKASATHFIPNLYNRQVWHWNHTAKTMVIYLASTCD